jgi:hypothetical protein
MLKLQQIIKQLAKMGIQLWKIYSPLRREEIRLEVKHRINKIKQSLVREHVLIMQVFKNNPEFRMSVIIISDVNESIRLKKRPHMFQIGRF